MLSDKLTIPNKVIHMGGGGKMWISPPHYTPPLAWGSLPPYVPVSPLPPCQNVKKGGIIPYVNQRKFSGKTTPLLKKVPHM